ncbi:MAG: TolC family protein [Bacteroidia bacterium]|nr:TolC family protein [Bacteroidia bacterium]
MDFLSGMVKSLKHTVFILTLSCTFTILNAQVKNLNEYINAAIANSPSLKENALQQMQTGIDSSIAIADYRPQISANGVGYYAPVYGQYGYDQAISNGGEYAALISISQQISPRNEISLKRRLASDERSRLLADSKVKENELRKEVTDEYLNACLLQQRLVFYIQSDSFLTQQNKIVKMLADKGSYKISDYYELLVEEKSERTQIARLKIDMEQAFSVLNSSCGIMDTVQYTLPIPDIQLTEKTDVTQLAVYQEFRADSVKLTTQDKLVDAGYRPRFSWYADAGILASQPNLISRSIGNSIGLNLTVPIYDGDKRKLKHQSLQLSQDSRINYQNFFEQNYNNRIFFLAKQIVDSRKLIVQLQQEEQEVKHWIDIDQAELAAGNIPVTDFLLSLKKNLEVKNDLNEALINQQSLQNEFNYRNR